MSGEEPPRQPRSKLEEQATSKKDLSYSYWAANAVTGAAPAAVPQKLTEEEAAAHRRQVEEHREATGASAWNKAGTFEERNVTEFAKEKLKELLVGCEARAQQGTSVSITAVASCSGEAHQWLIRGKKRAGFEFELSLKWRAELPGGERWAEGTARVAEISGDDLDELAERLQNVEVSERSKGLGGADEAAARQAARQALPPALKGRLRELLEQLKQR